MPVSFTPYLGWVDATDAKNIPNGFRIIGASDLLRYENYAVESKALINSLETKVNELQSMKMTTKTANYTIPLTEHLVIGNGASITLTLPSAVTAGAGKTFRIKNLHSTALSVKSTAGAIDGGTTKSLAQWASATFVSNGTVWYTV